MSKVLNAPERIWLVYGDNEWDVDHDDLDPEGVCWSHQREFPKDVEYVRAANAITWRKSADELPDSDRGSHVLAHTTEWDETRIVTVAIVRDYPDRFDWWAHLTRPPKRES